MTDITQTTNRSPARALLHLQGLFERRRTAAPRPQSSRSDGENVTLAVTGPDACLLVGPHGQTLEPSSTCCC